MRLFALIFLSALSALAADVTLSGAGATFPDPLYEKWFRTYEKQHSGLHVEYAAVGSGAGIDRLKAGAVDFAASDVPIPENSDVLQIPSVAGAVVPIYNLPGLGRDVRFTPELLAGIYLGRIRKWNDLEIKAANRAVALPDREITVIHRRDASGTTWIWTGFLSKASADWKARAGTGTTVSWPVGTPADQNAGVAMAVESTPFSIGYVEWIYAIQSHLNFGAIRNTAGKFVTAGLDSISAGISSPASADAWPIVSFTYLVLPNKSKDPARAEAMRDLLKWIYSYGQNQAAGLGYVALPKDVASKAAADAASLR